MIMVGGAGPGNPKYLTMEVYEKIKNTEVVVAFGRISETLKELNENIKPVKLVTDVLKLVEENEDKDILILASGDPNFYGIVNYLKNNKVQIDEVLPGLSSFQYLMSKLKLSWNDAKLLSLHGRDMSLEEVKNYEKSVILTDKEHTPSFISEKLKNIGVVGQLVAGYNLSYDSEEIIKIKIGEKIDKISPLAIVVILNEMD